MSHFEAYRNNFPNARLTRSKSGVLEVVFHTDGGKLVFNGHTHEQFVDLFHQIGSDPDNRVVILTGSGDAFMDTIGPDGFDFFTPQGYDKIYREGKKVLMNILDIEVPRRTARCDCTPNMSCSLTSCWPRRRRFFRISRTSNSVSCPAMESTCYGRK